MSSQLLLIKAFITFDSKILHQSSLWENWELFFLHVITFQLTAVFQQWYCSLLGCGFVCKCFFLSGLSHKEPLDNEHNEHLCGIIESHHLNRLMKPAMLQIPFLKMVLCYTNEEKILQHRYLCQAQDNQAQVQAQDNHLPSHSSISSLTRPQSEPSAHSHWPASLVPSRLKCLSQAELHLDTMLHYINNR